MAIVVVDNTSAIHVLGKVEAATGLTGVDPIYCEQLDKDPSVIVELLKKYRTTLTEEADAD